MYVRTTQRRNRDGSVVRYVQVAHNRRVDGVTQAEVLVNLGREDRLDEGGLRRLVGSDRAIVTPIPGTTRDIVRETIEIGGLPVTLADTAGLRETSDLVEDIGVRRAREAARSADLILAIAAVHGHTEPSVEERRMWLLSVLAFARVPQLMGTCGQLRG